MSVFELKSKQRFPSVQMSKATLGYATLKKAQIVMFPLPNDFKNLLFFYWHAYKQGFDAGPVFCSKHLLNLMDPLQKKNKKKKTI